jgi:hypothetical protein
MRSSPKTARPTKLALCWLWPGDPGGGALFLLHSRRPVRKHVSAVGWLWPGDPGGGALFLLHFRPRHFRRVQRSSVLPSRSGRQS